jgi:hypothetical protein
MRMAELLAIFSQHLNRKFTVLVMGFMTKDQVLACFASPNNCLPASDSKSDFFR